MGFLGRIGGAIKGAIGGAVEGFFGGSSRRNSRGSSEGYSGGSSSTSSTTYEPDKVKVAQIEADTKIRLSEMESERVELMKNAQIDLFEFNTNCQLAIEEAKARSLNSMAQTIMNLQTQLNEVGIKRLEIIEKGSLSIIKEIEGFYSELSDKIEEDNYKYSKEKLPKLLELLDEYEEGSAAHKLYTKRIDMDMDNQTKHYLMQIESISKRQDQIIEGFVKSKEMIIGQTNEVTKAIMSNIENKIAINRGISSDEEILKLPTNNVKMIENSKE